MPAEYDLSGVARDDIAKVLNRAADLIAERGWDPARSGDRINMLRAVTLACDEIAGPGVQSADLHMASLDALCLSVTGKPVGTGVSVSGWERRVAAEATAAALRKCEPDIIAALRGAV